MVHELIHAYRLNELMDCIKPRIANADDLALFHSNYYLNYLKSECADESQEIDTDSDESTTSDVDDEQLDYGLGYDCPKFQNLWKFATTIAGGSLSAAELLLNNHKTVINWCGGWHHSQRLHFIRIYHIFSIHSSLKNKIISGMRLKDSVTSMTLQ